MSVALIDKRYCNGCRYLSKGTNFWCCDYVFIADKRRPCPAGSGCTEKLDKKKKRASLTVFKKGKRKAVKDEEVD